MNKLILKFIFLFSKVFQRLGIDSAQLKIILSTKLKMDDRRPIMIGQNKPGKNTKYSTAITMLVLSLSGLFLAYFLSIEKPYVAHTIYFSAFMIMLAVTLISDFTHVLIDIKDNFIILPRPVSDRTFTVSRILHICIHVSKMAIAIAAAGFIYTLVTQSVVSVILFTIEVMIASVLSILLVNIIYLLVLKLSSPQKFKDFISYFQIIFSVAIFALYYLLPQFIQSSVFENLDLLSITGIFLLPSLWVASLHELSSIDGINLTSISYAVVALLSPIISVYLVVKVFAPGFILKLAAISGSGTSVVEITRDRFRKQNLMEYLSDRVTGDKVENAGFRLTWLLTSRFRDFKIKVYPTFAYVPVYFVYFAFFNGRNKGSFAERWELFREGHSYLFLAYLTGFVLITVLQHVSHTDKYKASWIYFSSPHDHPGRILGGMFKAVVIKYYLPYFFVIALFSLQFWGPSVINDLILVFFVSLIYGLLNALFMVKGLPFSKPPVTKAGSKVFLSFLLMMVPGGIGFAHYWLSSYEILIWCASTMGLLIYYFLFKNYLKENWDDLQMAE